MPPGTYVIGILWGSTSSASTSFTISAPANALGAPTLRPATVVGNTVTLTWQPGSGSATGYDLEATVQQTGQVVNLQVGNQAALTVNSVQPGTFVVRVRARNALGVSAYSNAVTLDVGR